MNLKTQSLWGLFIALIIILALNPKIVNNIYSSIIGRLLLICIVIFFTMNNTTLGLLVALVIITSLNQFGYFVEGMENQTETTIGEDNIQSTGTTQVLTKSATSSLINDNINSNSNNNKKLSEIKEEIASGVDKESIKQALMSKNSKTIPIDSNMTSSIDVSASHPGMIGNSKLEGFSSYASVY